MNDISPFNLCEFQEELHVWTQHNFGDHLAHQPLLGLLEEVGELSRSHIKQEQSIRTNEDHEANAQGAIGNILVYLADYCNVRGWDLNQIITDTWTQVQQRDWKANQETGLKGNQ